MPKIFRVTVDIELDEISEECGREEIGNVDEITLTKHLVKRNLTDTCSFERADVIDAVEIVRNDWNPENKPLNWCEVCHGYHVDDAEGCVKIN
jgi:hypothetical protein